MTTLTHDITALFTAALANPQCDTTRGALADAMQERDCWTRETILPWVLKWRDNDAPRLLYASWCEGNGEPERAEFIRIQVELATHFRARVANGNLPSHECTVCGALWSLLADVAWKLSWSLASAACGPCCDSVAMGEQIRELSEREVSLFRQQRQLRINKANFWRWTEGAQRLIPERILGDSDSISERDDYAWHCRFTRGFVTSISCTAADWLSHADAITREQPIERVWLTSTPEYRSNNEVFSKREYWFEGRENRWLARGHLKGDESREWYVGVSLHPPEGLGMALMRVEWPGIAFELPRGIGYTTGSWTIPIGS